MGCQFSGVRTCGIRITNLDASGGSKDKGIKLGQPARFVVAELTFIVFLRRQWHIS